MKRPTKEQLEYVKAFLGVVWIGILIIGGFVVVSYCWSEGFLPDGISFGDAFLLGYASFSFAVILVIGALFGSTCAFWLVAAILWIGNRYRKKRGLAEAEFRDQFKGKFNLCMSVVVTIPLAAVVIMLPGPIDMHLQGTAAFFFLLGFAGLCFFGVKAPQRQPMGLKVASWVGFLLVVVAMIGTRPALLNISMGMVGIRSLPSNLVAIGDSEYGQLSQVAKINNLNIKFCRLQETQQWGTFDARAVWNGIGTTSYVRLMDENSKGGRTVLVPVKKDGVEVLRGDNMRFVCR
ncbi:hypothetical protein [Paraburkholderia silvatlantica]|uniref:hypothetical protein n=1 Tax=Paraburkholderia silvatlantica TaxID=321895 RepID=UPI001062374C|nr:hypothetical protein [Paraburkholderia silvatlantica]TDQ83483.1 hypothetical protein C7412_12219 [Paraburkholderia silvatlantica]